MKKVLLLLSLLLLFALPANSISFRIALSDFAVHSDNPRYKYMGKGISEMIAVELAKATGVNLIEREKRAEVLEEIEFALSDLADATKQVEVGKMLAARYLVFGEIVDMDKEVLISLRMIDVESTMVVWNEQVVARITNYDYITGYFTMSILHHLGLPVPSSTVAKVEAVEEKNEDAVVAFSMAVDHYDKGEDRDAKKELITARRIDPKNEAIQTYISKLLLNISKFKIIPPSHLPNQNPAYLGILQYDQLFALFDYTHYYYHTLETYNLGYNEQNTRILLGYSIPVGQNFGIQFNGFFSADVEFMREPPYSRDESSRVATQAEGIQVSFGLAVSESVAVGMGASFFLEDLQFEAYTGNFDAPGTYSISTALYGGFLIKNQQATTIFDVLAGYSSGRQPLLHAEEIRIFLDTGTQYTSGDTIALPFFLESTLTTAFQNRRFFLILKQSNDIYFNRPYYTGRLIPAVEYWLSHRFAVRTGVDISLYKLDEVVEFGIGGIGGVSIRSFGGSWDLDLNVSYRKYPINSIPGEVFYQPVGYISFSKNRLFKTR
jgi:TolB-like protein